MSPIPSSSIVPRVTDSLPVPYRHDVRAKKRPPVRRGSPLLVAGLEVALQDATVQRGDGEHVGGRRHPAVRALLHVYLGHVRLDSTATFV